MIHSYPMNAGFSRFIQLVPKSWTPPVPPKDGASGFEQTRKDDIIRSNVEATRTMQIGNMQMRHTKLTCLICVIPTGPLSPYIARCEFVHIKS